jgi:hypothetical protein
MLDSTAPRPAQNEDERVTPRRIRRVRSDAVNARECGRTRIAASLAALVALVLLTGGASGAPDLVVADFVIDPAEPFPGAIVLLDATIENVGDEAAEGQFFVRFDIDGHLLDSVPINTDLRPGHTRTVTAEWVAEEGRHTVTAEVDHPFDRVHESNESNNTEIRDIFVPFPSDVASTTHGLRVAVGRFEDRSASGFVNVGNGVSDKLGERLAGAGVRVVTRTEIEETMQMQGLNPYQAEDVTAVASLLGADVLVTGSIVGINLAQSSISIGTVSIGNGVADVSIRAEGIDVATTSRLFELSAEGYHEGSTEITLDRSALTSGAGSDTCAGGLESDRDAYYGGESITIGYANPASASWYSVEIHSSTGTFLQWLGWQYVPAGGCGQWFWDQRDSLGSRVSPSVYVAKLWDGSNFVESASFEIRPGVSLFPLVDEITVGSATFESSIVGGAVNRAVDDLLGELIPSLEDVGSHMAGSPASTVFSAEEPFEPIIEGQVAAVLPDGRIAINIGSSAGVSRGDFFDVLDDDLSLRGEIVVVEVREHVSYAVKSTDFQPQIGDVVRQTVP